MAAIKLLDNATTDTVGTEVTNGAAFAVHALTLSGVLDGAFVDVLVDIGANGVWVTAGSLSHETPAKVILLPAGAKLNARLSGSRINTKVTVQVAA